MSNEVVNKIQSELGSPSVNEISRKPQKKVFLMKKFGDVSFNLESVTWPTRDTIDEWDEPIVSFFVTVSSFKNDKGFPIHVKVPGDPKSIMEISKTLSKVAEFAQKSGLDLGLSDYEKDEMDEAFAIYSKKV